MPFAGDVIISDVGFNCMEVAELESCYVRSPIEEESLAVASVLCSMAVINQPLVVVIPIFNQDEIPQK